MNLPRGEHVTDAVKQRREYLWKKASIACLTAAVVLLCAAGAICFSFWHTFIIRSGSWVNPTWPILVTVAFVAAAIRWSKQINEKSGRIPYVPPVREQVATLPANEVLLRSSDAPATTAGELLRAAHGGTGIREELMRASSIDESRA